MDHIPSEASHIPQPVLSRERQLWLSGGLAVLAVVLFWLVPLLGRVLFAAPPAPPAKSDDSSFAATDRQWQTLAFETVRPQLLADGVTTDGKIALDDDLTTPVMSPYTGRVTRVFVAMGDVVRAGQPLFAVQATEAAQTASDIATAAGQAMAARAAVRQTEAAEARQHDLYQHQGAALKDWQQAEVDLANARAAQQSADAALNAARAHGAAIGGVAAKGEAIVRAPISGVVTQRSIGVGQNIGSLAGSNQPTQAMTISNLSKLWVVGFVREEDAPRVHRGMDVDLTLGALPDHPIHARLDYVAPTIDPNTHRLAVHATIANPGGAVRPEMLGSLSLHTGAGRTVLSVPESAVLFEGTEARVWVATQGHRLGLRQIVAGAQANGRIEVVSGLKAGEQVVTAGALFIDRGAKED